MGSRDSKTWIATVKGLQSLQGLLGLRVCKRLIEDQGSGFRLRVGV